MKKRNVSRPEIINIDDIQVMDEDQLRENLFNLEEGRSACKTLAEAKPWEVEIAYFRREWSVRRARQKAHDDYVAAENLANQQFMKEEEELPSADMDNTQFTKLFW